MTIFKTQVKKAEKPGNGFVEVPQSQPLPAADEKVIVPPPVGVVLAARRRARLTHHCLILCVLLLMAIGVIGGIYIYRYFTNRPYQATCGLRYEPTMRGVQRGTGSRAQLQRAYMEEHVEIDRAGLFEKLEVPDFDDCSRAVVMHEFVKNLTAIVDKGAGHCFIMPLNRKEVRPPKDFWDLITKLRSGYYMPDSRIVRHYYKVEKPAVNPAEFGPYIANECFMLDTYRLRKRKRMEHERRRFFYSERFERKKARNGHLEDKEMKLNYGYFGGVIDERHTGLIVEQEVDLS